MTTASHTLTSKIRVLIARTYRAERLYASMRAERRSDLAESERLVGKLGNDVRSGEWQSAHQELRHRLNEIVRLNNRKVILAELSTVRESFARRMAESESAVVHGTSVVVEAAKRHEYGHVLKIALELIRHKSRCQTCKVILEEINSVLNAYLPQAEQQALLIDEPLAPLDTRGREKRSSSIIVPFVPELARRKRASSR